MLMRAKCRVVGGDLCTFSCLNGGHCAHPNSCNCSFYQATGVRCQTVPNTGFEREMTCRSWGQYNFETFDGLYFYYPGKCTYTLLRDCEDNTQSTILIQVHNDPGCRSSPYSCARSVSLFLPWEGEIRLQNFTVTFRGQKYSFPLSTYPHMSQSQYILVSQPHGFTLAWEGYTGSVYVKMSPEYVGRTCGMCGNFNADVQDDLKTSYGIVTEDVAMFGNSWMEEQPHHARCPMVPSTYPSPCDSQEPGMLLVCSALLKEPFNSCHEFVSPFSYMASCSNDLCFPSGDAVCQVFTEYARACAHADHPLHNWRTHMPACSVPCPPELQYNECITCCPESCNVERMCIDSKLQCLDGCYCPDDLIYEGGSCVQASDCPCEHRGMLYPPGQTIKEECNNCTCLGGVWNCTDYSCPGECSVTGDMYFQSFDGRVYTFPATCQYVLAKSRNSGKFTVTIQNAPCGPNLDGACIQSVNLVLDEDPRTEITMSHIGEVFIASQYRISLPYSDDIFHIQELSSMFLQVKTAQGLRLQYNWREFRLYLQVSEFWKEDTVGLCGTFNGNIQDDFLSPSGMIESTPQLFGNAWRISSACVPSLFLPQLDPCDTHHQAASYAVQMCDVLNQEIFSPCHEYLSPAPFHQQCRADTCKCGQPCLCSALAHYARQCRRFSVIVEFRTRVTECAIMCPKSMEYGMCVSSCQRRCQFLSVPHHCGEECEEGCVCPAGSFYDARTHSCVKKNECPCSFLGTDLSPGDIIMTSSGYPDRVITKYSFEHSSFCAFPDKTCPPGQWYHDCNNGRGKGVACEETCESHLLNLTCSAHEPCIPGCVCPPELLKHGDECFQPETCPCLWKGKEYFPGDKVMSPCHQCVCQHGTFQCVFHPCPSMCTVYGDRHYRTFDGLLYDYVGGCKAYLVKSSMDSVISVTAENVDCYETGVICRKSLMITIGRSFINFDDDSGNPNPLSVIDKRQNVYIWQAGYFTIVHAPVEDVTVLWDRKTTIHIQAGPRWQGKLTGLCGNFDLKTMNEMRNPENIDSATPQEFGNSWTAAECVNSPDIRHPCSVSPLREPFAKRRCSILLSEVFQVCHPVVDVTWFYMNCLADTCGCNRGGDCECFCTSVMVYAHQCCQQGVTVDWRSPSVCRDCNMKIICFAVLGKGPFHLVTYRERNTVLTANRSSGLVVPRRRPTEDRHFLSCAILSPDTSLVSFEAMDRPNYFLKVGRGGHLRLSKFQASESFLDESTFMLHRDTWISGYDSLESFSQPGFFLHYMLSWFHLMKYDHSDGFRRATLFRLTGVCPRCQWRYDACVSPCFKTCSDPSGQTCRYAFFCRVEGCIPVCPGDMVLDEVTHRCVHLEDFQTYSPVITTEKTTPQVTSSFETPTSLLTEKTSPMSPTAVYWFTSSTARPVTVTSHFLTSTTRTVVPTSPAEEPTRAVTLPDLTETKHTTQFTTSPHYTTTTRSITPTASLLPSFPSTSTKPTPGSTTVEHVTSPAAETFVPFATADSPPTTHSVGVTTPAATPEHTAESTTLFITEKTTEKSHSTVHSSSAEPETSTTHVEELTTSASVTSPRWTTTVSLMSSSEQPVSTTSTPMPPLITHIITPTRPSKEETSTTTETKAYTTITSHPPVMLSTEKSTEYVTLDWTQPSSQPSTSQTSTIQPVFPELISSTLRPLERSPAQEDSLYTVSTTKVSMSAKTETITTTPSSETTTLRPAFSTTTRTTSEFTEKSTTTPKRPATTETGVSTLSPTSTSTSVTFTGVTTHPVTQTTKIPRVTERFELSTTAQTTTTLRETPRVTVSLSSPTATIKTTESPLTTFLSATTLTRSPSVPPPSPASEPVSVALTIRTSTTSNTTGYTTVSSETSLVTTTTVPGPSLTSTTPHTALLTESSTLPTAATEKVLTSSRVTLSSSTQPPPFSEIIDECTKFICVGGQLVLFNKSQSCPYASTPPNCGLLGFAILVNGDKCCPKWDCPCRCSIFPDLNVITFDGNSVAVYKAASYVVTQLPNETISILVQECPASDTVGLLWNFSNLCLVALNITHKSQQVLINRLQRRVSFVPRFKKYGFEILDTGNMYLIRTPAGLKIQWFHSTGMMVIETESYTSKLRTLGLCGCCDGNPANDLTLPNGTTLGAGEDPGIFIDSWQEPNTTSYISQSRRREVNCSTSDCSECLAMLRNRTFIACHAYVSPTTFCEVWVRDAEYVNNPCVALAAYVASCHKFNVCIDWRTPEYCPFMCPEELRYQACLPACTAQSCPSHEFDYDPEQCYGLSEGCVCPEGTLLHRPYSALCIPLSKCACTDSFGAPRALGEVWKASKDGCCMYRCENDTIVPVELNCTDVTQPTCQRAGEVTVSIADDRSCCPQKVCVCNQSLCDAAPPVCKYGEKLVSYFREDSCCPEYACECDPGRCEVDVPSCRDDQVLIATQADGSCCLAHICLCETCLDITPECQEGELMIVDTNSTDRCCPVYHCACELHRCPQVSCLLGMTLVPESVPGRCCPVQTCECACDKIPSPKCNLGETIQVDRSFQQDPENRCGCKRHKCVRDAVCVDEERGVMRPGQTLVEHSEQGVCYSTHCTRTLDPLTGFYHMRTSSTNCSAQCQPNQIYVPPKDLTTCCGVCRNISCLHQSENGSVALYKPGKTWVSDCIRYDCADTQSGPTLVSSFYSCPPFNETECVKVRGCCKEDGKSCQKVTVRMTIRKNDCRSNRPVNIVSCDGKCPSASIYNYNINTYARFCKCCREIGLQRRSVQLYCSGNSTWVSYSIQEPIDCSCQWS
uniref:Otogelin n=1 Tax=Denticeps clupeoides TaxID=299321 RepID=A0AAY4C9Z8_9TELE